MSFVSFSFFLKRISKNKFEIILILPLALFVFGFTIGPIIQAIMMSFEGIFGGNFPTLASYSYIVHHHYFKAALFNTIFITGVGLSLELIFGMILALILSEKFFGRGIFRAVMLLPLGIPTIVSASNMAFIFSTQGFLNELLYRIGLIEVPIDWRVGTIKPLMTIVVADMWKVTPLVMLILLAGLESIDKQLYEAAKVDGAGRWHRFRHITLPLLKPYITMALVIRGIDAFRIFELPLVMAGRHVPVMSSYAYFEYVERNNPYTSAAGATILLIMIIIAISVYLKAVGTEEVTR
ncbi:MAG: sugar ABC transporter permease [Methanomicrobia archaeon]|nr:sugar ABC transporter permease [Methanomicrobia archaeon]